MVLRQGGREIRGQTADLAEGGMLVRASDTEKLSVGTTAEADLSGIGRMRARIVARSALGLHAEFVGLEAGVARALHERLDAIRTENKQFVDRAVDTAAMISMAFEEAVSSGELTREALFDTDYVAIEGTDPQQFRTRALDVLESCFRRSRSRCLASTSA